MSWMILLGLLVVPLLFVDFDELRQKFLDDLEDELEALDSSQTSSQITSEDDDVLAKAAAQMLAQEQADADAAAAEKSVSTQTPVEVATSSDKTLGCGGGDETAQGGMENDTMLDANGAEEDPSETPLWEGEDATLIDIPLADASQTRSDSAFTDELWVDVSDAVDDGYLALSVEGFDVRRDILSLSGPEELIGADGDGVLNPLTVQDNEDGTGAVVFIEGIMVVEVFGAAGMSPDNILIEV